MQGHHGCGDARDLGVWVIWGHRGMWGRWEAGAGSRACAVACVVPRWGQGSPVPLAPMGAASPQDIVQQWASPRVGWHHAGVLGTSSCHRHGPRGARALPCLCPLLSPALRPPVLAQDTGLGTDPFIRPGLGAGWARRVGTGAGWAQGGHGEAVGTGTAWARR